MSVQTEIDRIIELVNDSHEKAKAKGGTTSTPYLLANLPDAIESIKGSSGNAQPEHVLKDYTFSNDDGADKVGTCTYDADTSDADLGNSEGASVSEFLGDGYTGYAKGEKIRGNAEIADGITLGVPKNIVKSTGTGYDSCDETANAIKNMAYSTSKNYIYPGAGFDVKLKPALIIKQMFSDELETRANPEDVAEGKWCYGNDNYRRIWGTYSKPSGTLSITENGTHDVTNYASAEVNVAGSGGDSVETCTVEILCDAPATNGYVHYVAENMVVVSQSMTAMDWMGKTFSVVKGAILVIEHPFEGYNITGNAERLGKSYGNFAINGDCTIIAG